MPRQFVDTGTPGRGERVVTALLWLSIVLMLVPGPFGFLPPLLAVLAFVIGWMRWRFVTYHAIQVVVWCMVEFFAVFLGGLYSMRRGMPLEEVNWLSTQMLPKLLWPPQDIPAHVRLLVQHDWIYLPRISQHLLLAIFSIWAIFLLVGLAAAIVVMTGRPFRLPLLGNIGQRWLLPRDAPRAPGNARKARLAKSDTA